MSHIQTVLQILQLIATVAVAAIATYIAYRQWRTAHERFVLELWERRMATWDEARKILGGVVRTGNATDQEIGEFYRLSERIKMVFGDDVVASADKARKAVDNLHVAKMMLTDSNLTQSERLEHAQAAGRSMQEVIAFYDEFSRLIVPYVRMTQKLI